MRLDINRPRVGLLPRGASSARFLASLATALLRVSPWWVHFEFTRINLEPTILQKRIEERRVLCAFASMGECPVAVLWVRRSETNRPSKCLEDPSSGGASAGFTRARKASSMTASLLFHQR
jgi:hypothetical protein